MRGHAGSAPEDKPITTRLTPELVLAAKGIESEDSIEIPEIDTKSYTLLYRMWGNHQKLMFQNKNMGFLEINKETNNDLAVFNVTKVIVNYHNLNQTIRARLICRNDGTNAPVSYEYSSRVTDHALCTRNDLSLDRTGKVRESHVLETINGSEYRRDYNGRLMFDFTVYDMVAMGTAINSFTYYENLYSLKPNNRLFAVDKTMYLGKHDLGIMIQTGTALTERIFYRTENGVPTMMVQNSAVYILDKNAREATEKLKEELNTGGVHYEY